MIRRAAIVAIVALCAVYVGDYVVLRVRMARNANAALGSVQVVYGAALKDGRATLFTDQPQSETCVRSIFPHLGYSPCWYASKHAVQIVN